MAFTSPQLTDIQAIGPGELVGANHVILPASTFQNGLYEGRFAKLDTGSLDNLDGSATPVIAGVVRRMITNPIENDNVIDNTLFKQVEYVRQGVVTVRVKSGETPTQFGRVYISNAGDANDGMATANAADVPVNAEFIREEQTGVWAIYVNPAPGDVAAHVGTATGAHAASAISVLDSAGLTATINVETALAEILPTSELAIADPGDAGAIPVIRSGNVPITTAGAETRTIAAPTTSGVTVDLSLDVFVGNCVVTSATPVNVTGNNTITFTAAGQHISLKSMQVGGSLVWRAVSNDGAGLTTV